ncbi:MAG: helix-turn-helix domain-containing protein [Terracidiphilus sp.]
MNLDSTAAGQNQDGTSLSPRKPRRPKSAAGQLARVAALLRERRTRGLSSIEAIEFGILRLPNRIGELRKSGWTISSKREPTDCLRYFVVSEPAGSAPPDYEQRTRQIDREALPLFAGTGTQP